MKHIVGIIAFFVAPVLVFGQRAEADQIATNKGSLTIQPVTHASLVLSWDGKTIYVDPFGGKEGFNGLAAPDLVLITDIHGDHLNVGTLEQLETGDATFVAPQAVADQLPDEFKKKLIVIANGESKTVNGIPITAVPMYNLPESADSRHTKGRGNGYVLTLGGKQVYLSGDTDGTPEMRNLRNIDVAFVCMNPPFTMDVKQAAEAVLAFKPKIIYPYHYRGSNTDEFRQLVNTGNSSIDVRLRNWYP